MSAAKHDEELSVQRAESTLTPTQEAEVAKLSSSNARLWKIVFGTLVLLFLSWLSNTGLMVAVVLAKEQLKVEDGSLKNMDGGAVSTHGQKNVHEVTLVSSRRALGEQGGDGTHEHEHASAAWPTSTRRPWPKCPARTCCWPSRRSRTVTTRAW